MGDTIKTGYTQEERKIEVSEIMEEELKQELYRHEGETLVPPLIEEIIRYMFQLKDLVDKSKKEDVK